MDLAGAAEKVGIPESELLLREEEFANSQSEFLAETFKANALLCNFLYRLVEKNNNVSLELAFCGGVAKLPYRYGQTLSKNGGLAVAVYLRVGTAGVYWPGSTNPVQVASIESSSTSVRFISTSLSQPRTVGNFNLIIQNCSFTDCPVALSGIPFQEVEAIYKQVQDDIEELYDELFRGKK